MTETAGTYAYAIDFSRDGGATFDRADLVHWGAESVTDPAGLVRLIANKHKLTEISTFQTPRVWRVRAWHHTPVARVAPARAEIDELAGTPSAATWTTPASPADDGHDHRPPRGGISTSVARADGSRIAASACLICRQPIHVVAPFGVASWILVWQLATVPLPDPEPGVITTQSDTLPTGEYDGWQIRNKANADWITVVSARAVDRSWVPFRTSDTAIEVTTPERIGQIDPGYTIQARPISDDPQNANRNTGRDNPLGS